MEVKILAKYFKCTKEVFRNFEKIDVCEFCLPNDDTYVIEINAHSVKKITNSATGTYFLAKIYEGYENPFKKVYGREESKRYKQYKYTCEEIKALYEAELDKANKKTTLCLAHLKIYLNNNTYCARDVEEEVVLLGERDEVWFYSDKLDTKRRLNTKGVDVLFDIDEKFDVQAQKLWQAFEREMTLCCHKIDLFDRFDKHFENFEGTLCWAKNFKEFNLYQKDLDALETAYNSLKQVYEEINYKPSVDELIEKLKKYAVKEV